MTTTEIDAPLTAVRLSKACDDDSTAAAERDDEPSAATAPWREPRTERAPDLAIGPARVLYEWLLQRSPGADALTRAREWLAGQLEAADTLPCDLPEHVDDLPAWMVDRHADVGRRYQDYLAGRQAGAPRQYFSSKAHALYFLRGVAPTKMVDGAWLYGLAHHWHDDRFDGLLTTYLEELGDGDPQANHVTLYRELLAAHGCEGWQHQPDARYVQGAIQLALAHGAGHALPEVIGFNLGYEQLPLHLLITAYELNELGIDPYYFTVHVTVDNGDSGHARRAIDAVRAAWPAAGDGEAFWARVRRGYRLNDLGSGTVDVIGEFDLDAELADIVVRKSAHGRHAHSDYCRVAGRTVNDWLSKPGDAPAFLEALQRAGWIHRHQDPANSRFWRLVQGERAEMFGVFSPYELQVLHDWIAGDALATKRALPYRARRRLRDSLGTAGAWMQARPSGNDFDAELAAVRQQVAAAPDRDTAMRGLADLIGPATHATPAGLLATRLFSRMRHAAG